MLFFPRETFPTDRVRLNALFGRELLGRGHAIDVVMQANGPEVSAGRHSWYRGSVVVGATANGSGLFGRITTAIRAFVMQARFLSTATRERYDSILVSDKYLLAVLSGIVASARGLKFYFWMTYPYHDAQLTLARERLTSFPFLAALRGRMTSALLFRWILPRADHVFVQSQKMAQNFASRGVPTTKMTSVVTGIDIEGLDALPIRRWQRNPTQLTIGYLGTLVRQRRMEILIDTLKELRKRGIAARLLLVGDGASPADRAHLLDCAEQLGLRDSVEITGFLPRDLALQRILTADICVSPFRPTPALEVASPTKLIEYLALGLPVVANSHPDQTAILRQCRAGVIVPWRASHFARAIAWIARRSECEISEMAARGKQWVLQNRTYASIADRFEKDCLDAVAAEFRPPDARRP
jgi:glycosyltransferase involved in cell wall biosynthesis